MQHNLKVIRRVRSSQNTIAATRERRIWFFKFYSAHSEAIFRHCFFRVSSRQKAEDLAQETFLRAWEQMERGAQIENIKAFLYRVANNLIIDFYRSKSRKDSSLEALMDEGVSFSRADHELLLDSIEKHEILRKLEHLEKGDREIILMRFVKDMSPFEIATTLGVSENAVSVRVYRALRRFKEVLRQSGD